jgi:hypothetical protein
MGYSSRDRVTMATQEYNEGVKWGKLDQAGIHVQKDQRKRFFDRHKAVEDDLEIADYELTQLNIDKSDKKHDRATARVEYVWTLKTVGLVEKTATEQKWEEQNGEWVMVSETRIKGAPLNLFDEPAKDEAKPAKDEAKPDKK